VIRYTGDVPFATVSEAKSFIRSYDHYERYGFGRWSVFTKDTDDYIGFCGLNYRPALDEVDVARILRIYWERVMLPKRRGQPPVCFTQYALDKIVARAMQGTWPLTGCYISWVCATKKPLKRKGQSGVSIPACQST